MTDTGGAVDIDSLHRDQVAAAKARGAEFLLGIPDYWYRAGGPVWCCESGHHSTALLDSRDRLGYRSCLSCGSRVAIVDPCAQAGRVVRYARKGENLAVLMLRAEAGSCVDFVEGLRGQCLQVAMSLLGALTPRPEGVCASMLIITPHKATKFRARNDELWTHHVVALIDGKTHCPWFPELRSPVEYVRHVFPDTMVSVIGIPGRDEVLVGGASGVADREPLDSANACTD